MALFRTHVLLTPFTEESTLDVLTVLENAILDMIQMERDGEVVDRALIRACCYMLEGLYTSFTEDENSKLYLASFEPKFLESSRAFYRQEGQTLLTNADASTFCSQARRRLREEEERCQQTLSMLTEPKIKSVVDNELILAHIRDVINMETTGVKNMLDNDRVEDLINVYNLISRVDPKKAALKDAVQKRVVDLGSEINRVASVIPEPGARSVEKADGEKQPEKPLNHQTAAAITWVEDILKLKAKYDRLWDVAFKRDVIMEQALQHSFQDFINANNRSPEHLSLFLDEYLKKGGKGKTDTEVDALLDKGVMLLQYITDKDLFEAYYKKHMAKRLLMKRSVSKDMERQMISKMKMKIGNTFTQKMEGLLKDMNVSDDLNSQYKESIAQLGDLDLKRIDIEARILTTTVWPFDHLFRTGTDDGAPRLACVYPAEIERVRAKFERFYLGKHSGRALSWLPGMGDADIRATFKGANGKTRRHELNVSTYSMIILLLFNDLPAGQSLTFDEIMAQTNIPKHELIRNLQSLALAPKTRVLKKEPMSKAVQPSDKFFFNEEFTSQFVRVKIGVVASNSNKVENSDERRETQKRADEERGVAIEAAIVRIMKQRKSLSHQQLMAETLQQLSSRFQPDVNMVKKKIEALIDREYLERGPDADKPSYQYLA
jgi:cullin 3